MSEKSHVNVDGDRVYASGAGIMKPTRHNFLMRAPELAEKLPVFATKK